MRMIEVFYDGFQARVLHDGYMTELFNMSTECARVPAQPPSLPRQTLGDNETGIHLTLLQK